MPGSGKFQAAVSSGEQLVGASPVTIRTGACFLTGVQIITNGTDNATVILYDNTAASGTVVFEGTVEGTAAVHYGGRNWTFPVVCNNGLCAAITGTGASCIVEYVPHQ